MTAEFELVAFADGADLVGARWWNRSLRRRVVTRRALLAAAGVGAVSALLYANRTPTERRASIRVQRDRGWDFGAGDVGLDQPAAVPSDACGRPAPDGPAADLAVDLAPPAPWASAYRPTLFHALSADRSRGARRLAALIRPMFSGTMADAFARGRALSAALGADAPLVVIDLAGPRSIAMAAGMADRFFPVFVFDNWPHPRGYVPSHLTLAAAVSLACVFVAARATEGRSPVIVLDRARLRRADAGFDNRYAAPMPGAPLVAGRRVLYVHDQPGEAGVESDDLNEWAVEVSRNAPGQGGFRALAYDDFWPCPGCPPLGDLAPDALDRVYRDAARVAYGGGADLAAVYGLAGAPAAPPDGVSRGHAYVPRARPTVFAFAHAVRDPAFGTTEVEAEPPPTVVSNGSGGSYSRSYGGFGG